MFHSESLAKAVSALAPHAENLKDKADKISDDIRELEKFLNLKFLGLEVGVSIAEHPIDEEHMKLFELARFDKNLDFLLREFLVWGRDESSQKFRLLYETHYLMGDPQGGYRIQSRKKPLIECSLFDRLRVHPRLTFLVEHIRCGLLGED